MERRRTREAAKAASARSGAKIRGRGRTRPHPVVVAGAMQDLAPTHDLLAEAGDLQVWLTTREADVVASQRLRYQVFYEEMAARPTAEMAASGLDIDAFDTICEFIIVVDNARDAGDRLVGTYRLLRQEVAARTGGFYSAGEYDLAPLLAELDGEMRRGLELGRSCVHADYRTKVCVQLLWRGIAVYLARARVTYMFGCASLPGTDPKMLAKELSYLHHHHLAPPELRVRALPERYEAMDRLPVDALSPARVLAKLPPLLKGDLRLGAHIGDGAVIDHQFATTDVFILLPVARIAERYFSHFDPADKIRRPE